jgi:uncharacterized membrane protein YhaH (DUF805 family)
MFGNMTRSKYWWTTLFLILMSVWALIVFRSASHVSVNAGANVLIALLILAIPFTAYNWYVAFARLRDIGLVTWLAAVLTVLQLGLLLAFPLWLAIEIIIWIVVGFIPTGAASGEIRFVERRT